MLDVVLRMRDHNMQSFVRTPDFIRYLKNITSRVKSQVIILIKNHACFKIFLRYLGNAFFVKNYAHIF